MEIVGPAWGGKKANLRINPGSTHGLEPEEERWRGRPLEEPEERVFLGNYQTSG